MEDYKQRYGNLVERLKQARKEKGGYTFSSVLDDEFPELNESEEQRIRKNLREFLLDAPSQDIVSHHLDLDETLTWLEKPTWSEDDEEILEGLNNCLTELEEKNGWRYVYINNKDLELCEVRNWLKSLKERMKGE